MNVLIFTTTILLSFINIVSSMNNYGLRIKNNSLKFILFKDKNNIKLFKGFKKFYERCYNKSIAKIGEGMFEYHSLTEEEKIIIETVISLCY